MRWGWQTFPVGLLAAWSVTLDSVVLVQVAEWLVPESLVCFTTLFPEEAVDGEDTNASHFFSFLLSDLSFKTNDFCGVELGTPLLLLSWGSASPSLSQVGPGDVRGTVLEEGPVFMVLGRGSREWKKRVYVGPHLDVLIISESLKTN